MAASAILNLYLAILGHPRSLLMDLKPRCKFGVNRTFTFQDIVIFFEILQIWLKTHIQAPKITFLEDLTPKCYFSLLRAQNALPWLEHAF